MGWEGEMSAGKLGSPDLLLLLLDLFPCYSKVVLFCLSIRMMNKVYADRGSGSTFCFPLSPPLHPVLFNECRLQVENLQLEKENRGVEGAGFFLFSPAHAAHEFITTWQ